MTFKTFSSLCSPRTMQHAVGIKLHNFGLLTFIYLYSVYIYIYIYIIQIDTHIYIYIYIYIHNTYIYTHFKKGVLKNFRPATLLEVSPCNTCKIFKNCFCYKLQNTSGGCFCLAIVLVLLPSRQLGVLTQVRSVLGINKFRYTWLGQISIILRALVTS